MALVSEVLFATTAIDWQKKPHVTSGTTESSITTSLAIINKWYSMCYIVYMAAC